MNKKKPWHVDDNFWQNASLKTESDETIDVLHTLFDYILETLSDRIDEVRTVNNIMLSFFSNGREIISITVCKKNLRIYIHPPSGALFEPYASFRVERFNLWQTSFVKSKGMYCGMTIWVSKIEHIEGMKEVLMKIPDKVE
jgi:hypothetical protein